MKKAIQFGAGNIGRGFIGALLSKSSYEVIFCDVNKEVIDKINEDKKYNVIVKDLDERVEVIENIRGLYSTDEKVICEISNSNIITTAVGVLVLPKIAKTISQGLIKKLHDNNHEPINIIACENSVNATDILKEEILKYLDDSQKEAIKSFVGFPNCSVDRIVPPTNSNSIDVNVEEFFEWNVEKNKIIGEFNVDGVNLVEDLSSYIERKLFTLNTAHAMVSYLGFSRGHKTILDSINDEFVYKNVYEAMLESGEGLILKYNFNREEHLKYIDKIIKRFKNPYLVDDVLRVGREPMRKLSRNDRFFKPILTAYGYGKSIDKLCLGAAYGLKFVDSCDENSLKMDALIKEKGVREALIHISQVYEDEIIDKVINYYHNI